MKLTRTQLNKYASDTYGKNSFVTTTLEHGTITNGKEVELKKQFPDYAHIAEIYVFNPTPGMVHQTRAVIEVWGTKSSASYYAAKSCGCCFEDRHAKHVRFIRLV